MKKKNLPLIISGIIILVIGIVSLIIAYSLEGADFIAWLKSKYGAVLISVLVIYITILGVILTKDWIRKL